MSGPLVSASAAFVAKNSRIPPYAIEQSLQFDGDSYFQRDPSSAGNRRTWTFSFWLKRAALTGDQTILMTPKNSGYSRIDINSSSGSSVNFLQWNGSSYDFRVALTVNRLRDPSAWYHIVVAVDTTQSTASNRVKFYVNGSLETDLNPSSNTYPSQNFDIELNGTGRHYLGLSSNYGLAYLNGYLAEVNYIDGSQLAATDFGEYDDNGVWRPIEYSGSYTGNSYYLKFDAADIGGDSSGLGNDWTSNGGFTTSGTETDVMSDTPTTNYPTINPIAALDPGEPYNITGIKNGNLEVDNVLAAGSGNNTVVATFQIPTSGKWYWEVTCREYSTGAPTRTSIGVMSNSCALGSDAGDFVYADLPGVYSYAASGVKCMSPSLWNSTYGSSYGNGDVIGVAFDADNGDLYFYKNGTIQNSGTAAFTGLDMTDGFFPAVGYWGDFTFNFGQRAFEYTVPTGYSELNTSNLPAPTVKDGSDYFQTVLWTGNSTDDRNITVADNSGNTWQPDLVWIKARITAYLHQHELYDAVRGATKRLQSNDTAAEDTAANNMQAFNSDGFQVGTAGSVNASSDGYVAWNWKADNTSGSSNTDGSITSTVSANPTAGFSIVQFDGTGANGSIGHGLGVAPSFIVAKSKTHADNWFVYHSAIGPNGYIMLNQTAAVDSPNSTVWQNVSPTSTVFYASTGGYNDSGQTIIAYCFAEVEGYSKFTSYTGNNNNDGVFCYLGFKPSWLLIKGTNAAYWYIWDEQRSTYNPATKVLLPSDSAAEQDNTTRSIDFLSNGFKLRTNDININANGQQYIVAAFASNPFGGSGVSPATAR